MRPYFLFIFVLAAFALSFSRHISFLMYPLSVVIFYLYLPVLYASSRINILHHKKEQEIFHIKFYPIELSMWLVSTLFFGFMLSHLIADLLFPYREYLYHFTIFLITFGMGCIVYCESIAENLHTPAKNLLFKLQGRLVGFELLFIMTLLFAMNH